jgi:hypothetical protein
MGTWRKVADLFQVLDANTAETFMKPGQFGESLNKFLTGISNKKYGQLLRH